MALKIRQVMQVSQRIAHLAPKIRAVQSGIGTTVRVAVCRFPLEHHCASASNHTNHGRAQVCWVARVKHLRLGLIIVTSPNITARGWARFAPTTGRYCAAGPAPGPPFLVEVFVAKVRALKLPFVPLELGRGPARHQTVGGAQERYEPLKPVLDCGGETSAVLCNTAESLAACDSNLHLFSSFLLPLPIPHLDAASVDNRTTLV